uniref:uncharacterized protein LOC122610330 n=1 Tax=Erigeron canadensis TaxID=72917 RepID=UPI001CB9D755|nr:uncharacterized protein LOC122610330 [Erigeron canadensis]
MESHVEVSRVVDVCRKICRTWNWTSNGGVCSKGTRIIIGWNTDVVDLMVISQTEQVMHTQVIFKQDKKSLFCSFVYARNYYKEKRMLWADLCKHKGFVRDQPWVILGDFNSSLNLDDNYSSSSNITIGMRDFKECVEEIEVMDINCYGLHYTWNQKPKHGTGIFKKIDRVMGNMRFIDDFPAACAIFQPYRISDHSPCVLKLPSISRSKPKPFKFSNLLIHIEGFLEALRKEWETEIGGHYMFRATQKLNAIKKPMRKMLHDMGNLHARVDMFRTELDAAQVSIDHDPSDPHLREQEASCLKLFHQAKLDEERFLKQKAKIEWLEAGDANSAFFHRSLKYKNHRSRIEVIKDANGVLHEGGDAPLALVDHYKNILGVEDNNSLKVPHHIFQKTLNHGRATYTVRSVSNEEIRKAMLSSRWLHICVF